MILLTPEQAHEKFQAVFALKTKLTHWDTGQTDQEFIQEYFTKLPVSLLLCEEEKSELKRFAYIIIEDKPTAYFWLIYSSKDSPMDTHRFISRIKSYLKGTGFKTVEFKTTNTQLSYERWVKKFGARVVEKTFNVTL